jgi:hypothetical protein
MRQTLSRCAIAPFMAREPVGRRIFRDFCDFCCAKPFMRAAVSNVTRRQIQRAFAR